MVDDEYSSTNEHQGGKGMKNGNIAGGVYGMAFIGSVSLITIVTHLLRDCYSVQYIFSNVC